MSLPRTPGDGPVKAAGRDTRGGQRFGHVTDRQPGGHLGTYLVRDEETGVAYAFGYADIVTEGLRTIRTGERVRFLIDRAHPGRASYVIRLDLPDIGEYYT
jgi:hypothetical protein